MVQIAKVHEIPYASVHAAEDEPITPKQIKE
jgi:hypothetical protein